LEAQIDTRQEQLQDWLAACVASGSLLLSTGTQISLSPASADASFRRYFRISAGNQTWIAMDAPPPQEDCRPFVRIAELMRAAGINTPGVLAQDIERGFLLLSDLGAMTYLDALTNSNADELFRDATEALLRLQLASRPGVLPPYNEVLLRREMDLYADWYVARHLEIQLRDEQKHTLAEAMTLIVKNNLSQPMVYVHRDFMPRNLMVSQPNPGVLDFQDAAYGPITYDVVSLFKDAFISWEEARVLEWAVRYWEKAKRAGLPVNADFGEFYRDFEWMGLQRHLKVMGIFARINYRDGKPGYLKDTPRFVRYIGAVCARYPALAPLARLVDQLENCSASVGYIP
jgi:aminoglycoside/choline kinase family phosphotransferase